MTVTQAQVCVLRFLSDSGGHAWVSLFRIDHLRRLAPDDLIVLPSLVEGGLVEHDPAAGAIRITAAGLAALA